MNTDINTQSTRKPTKKVDSKDSVKLCRLVLDEGITIVEAAEFIGIPYENERKLIAKEKKKNSLSVPAAKMGAPKKMDDETLTFLEDISRENSSYTLKDMKDIMSLKHNKNLSLSTIKNGLAKLAITIKKASYTLEKVNNEETLTKRADYASFFSIEAPNDKSRCLFIDESGFNYHLRRSRARSKKGSRAIVPIPNVRGRSNTLIIAASSKGIVHHKTISDGTCNGEKFATFISELIMIIKDDEQYLGAWFILDNVRIHGVQEVRDLVSNSGFRLVFLSPYSYMLNPVENIFSKVKIFVRSKLSGSQNENIDMVITINEAVANITPENCVNYVMHMLNNLSLAINRYVFQ